MNRPTFHQQVQPLYKHLTTQEENYWKITALKHSISVVHPEINTEIFYEEDQILGLGAFKGQGNLSARSILVRDVLATGLPSLGFEIKSNILLVRKTTVNRHGFLLVHDKKSSDFFSDQTLDNLNVIDFLELIMDDNLWKRS
jgi:hypothetical protein